MEALLAQAVKVAQAASFALASPSIITGKGVVGTVAGRTVAPAHARAFRPSLCP
ncbi:hypothetical protein [Sorangium sp. So ce131]|uniref:hypothetical protein n=1 Tax=Sorangium sp. So ce131 TaxID=3133282 RepID=UPI003F5EC86A